MEVTADKLKSRWGSPFVEEVAIGWMALKKKLLIAGAWGGLIFLILLALRESGAGLLGAAPEASVAMRPFLVFHLGIAGIVLGLLAPMVVWRSHQPYRRSYFWSLPGGRVRRTLLRIWVGWLWVLVVTAIWVLAWTALWYAAESGDLIATLNSAGAPWLWAVPFGTASVGYMWGTALTVGSDHPARSYGVFLLCLVAYVGSTEFTGSPVIRVIEETVRSTLQEGPFGWIVLLSGHVRDLAAIQVVDPVLGMGPIRPDGARWFSALALWITLTAAVACFSASRYQER